MPNDKNGALVKVGDTVIVPCVITSITEGTEYCNVTMETVEPMYPGDSKNTIVLNAKQVEKTGDAPAVEDPAAGDPAPVAQDAIEEPVTQE